MALPSPTHAQTIVRDGFSGTNGATLSARIPDTTNLPGGSWTLKPFHLNGSFSGTVYTTSGAPAPSARFSCSGNSGGCIAYPISSQGSYVKPQQFNISVRLAPGTSDRSVGLGFYSGTAGTTVESNFTGLVFSLSTRNMVLYQNGVAGQSIAFTGTWNAAVYHTFSYTVDTVTGAISEVTMEGSSSNYSFRLDDEQQVLHSERLGYEELSRWGAIGSGLRIAGRNKISRIGRIRLIGPRRCDSEPGPGAECRELSELRRSAKEKAQGANPGKRR